MNLEKFFPKGERRVEGVKDENTAESRKETKKNYWESWEPKLNERLFIKRSNGEIEGDWTVSEIYDQAEGKMIMATKPNIESPEITLRKSISEEELSKINDKQNLDFTEAVDLRNLYRLINYQKGLRDNNRDYLPEILINMIERVKAGELSIDRITEVNNLRAAVRNILEKEKK